MVVSKMTGNALKILRIIAQVSAEYKCMFIRLGTKDPLNKQPARPEVR